MNLPVTFINLPVDRHAQHNLKVVMILHF